MNFSQIAKDIRKEAAKAAKQARKGGDYFYRHRSIEICTVDASGRVNDSDPEFLELREVSGKALKRAFANAAEGSKPFTAYGVTGGIDTFDSLADMMEGYHYNPWSETWDLEYTVEAVQQKRYTITDGEVREQADSVFEACKIRTWMAKGIGLPSCELWIENTLTGEVVMGRKVK